MTKRIQESRCLWFQLPEKSENKIQKTEAGIHELLKWRWQYLGSHKTRNLDSRNMLWSKRKKSWVISNNQQSHEISSFSKNHSSKICEEEYKNTRTSLSINPRTKKFIIFNSWNHLKEPLESCWQFLEIFSYRRFLVLQLFHEIKGKYSSRSPGMVSINGY